MCKKSQYPFFILVFLFSFIAKQVSAQQKSTEAQQAQWIYNISYGITWEDEANITTYTIGVFSSKKLFSELQKLAETKQINGKPIKVVRYLNYNDIQANQIVFVSKNENAYLDFVYQKLKEKNVLIVSDRSKEPEYSILNFRKIGGNRETIQKIYADTNRNLLNAQKI